MTPDVEILLAEYSEMRQAERALRAQLYVINGFALAVASGLFIGVTTYRLEPLALLSPFIWYLVGYQWSSDALRLSRVIEHCRSIERELRLRVNSTPPLPLGFEDARHPGHGLAHLIRFQNFYGGAAAFYGIFFALFFYLMLQSPYVNSLKYSLMALCLLVGGVIWCLDLWRNRTYLFRPRE
jgi:hypothetical protein